MNTFLKITVLLAMCASTLHTHSWPFLGWIPGFNRTTAIIVGVGAAAGAVGYLYLKHTILSARQEEADRAFVQEQRALFSLAIAPETAMSVPAPTPTAPATVSIEPALTARIEAIKTEKLPDIHVYIAKEWKATGLTGIPVYPWHYCAELLLQNIAHLTAIKNSRPNSGDFSGLDELIKHEGHWYGYIRETTEFKDENASMTREQALEYAATLAKLAGDTRDQLGKMCTDLTAIKAKLGI